MTPPPSSSYFCSLTTIDSICLGTGRFLRAVWIPALQAAHYHPVLVQPRGRSFVEDCLVKGDKIVSLPVDTVLASGDIQTNYYDCYGAFSWGTEPDQQVFYHEWWKSVSLDPTKPFLIAIGVTEAGLAAADTEAMQQLFRFLCSLRTKEPATKICVVNTDNVPLNGNVIRQHMMTLLQQHGNNDADRQFLEERVVFLNSMVDRITSHRPNDVLVPRAEPQPAKAFVVADLGDDLPSEFHTIPGVILRSSMEALQQDVAWKLRIANGTHTAIAHALALCSCLQTTILSSPSSETSRNFLTYLDALVQDQILRVLPSEAQLVWDDWRQRLLHPHFGLSTFFITQNGAAKGGIRFGPTVADLLRQEQPVTVAMAWAFAVLLRWLTPAQTVNMTPMKKFRTRYRGWLNQFSREHVAAEYKQTKEPSDTTEEYGDRLAYNLNEGWYDFRCTCMIQIHDLVYNLSHCLARGQGVCRMIIRAYLVAEDGGNLQEVAHLPYFETFVDAVGNLYADLILKNNVLDHLDELVRTNALGEDCQIMV
ncbi:hypothetical protein FisN_31Hh070 [Fistulifera solaris]|uniref:Mannitol dehydrogenase N-terminal domain-containing protein n=1 Tax=Fistulifera solaris TaxID=1519565 RepID=A0A1Z5JAE1_FISSO|nr:hypothetical protein FisN_31Hh070 [Fistulifera solaris]|eukprot:GAX10862.1 hypothetical protein FisN_31Hh070 [Fistulifera solaris]